MNKDNKIIITAILIILVALISFNLSNTLTGQVVSKGDTTIISISPTKVSQGGIITITVDPGKQGSDERISFYNNKKIRQATTSFICSGSLRCTRENDGVVTKTYKIDSSWTPEVYYAEVFDYGSKTFVRSYFTVTPSGESNLGRTFIRY